MWTRLIGGKALVLRKEAITPESPWRGEKFRGETWRAMTEGDSFLKKKSGCKSY